MVPIEKAVLQEPLRRSHFLKVSRSLAASHLGRHHTVLCVSVACVVDIFIPSKGIAASDWRNGLVRISEISVRNENIMRSKELLKVGGLSLALAPGRESCEQSST